MQHVLVLPSHLEYAQEKRTGQLDDIIPKYSIIITSHYCAFLAVLFDHLL